MNFRENERHMGLSVIEYNVYETVHRKTDDGRSGKIHQAVLNLIVFGISKSDLINELPRFSCQQARG